MMNLEVYKCYAKFSTPLTLTTERLVAHNQHISSQHTIYSASYMVSTKKVMFFMDIVADD